MATGQHLEFQSLWNKKFEVYAKLDKISKKIVCKIG